MLCSFGCGREAIKTFKSSGRACCSNNMSSCPGTKEKQSLTKKGKPPPFSRGFTGKVPWNKGLTAKTDERVRRSSELAMIAQGGNPRHFAGREHSQETKDQIARAMRGNKNGIHRGNKGATYNGIRMDSMWEVAVAEYLDRVGIEWEYSPCVFPLSERRSYRPDFRLADGSFIEVKGYWRPENRAKFSDFLSKYPEVKIDVWEKPKLLELGLIDRAGYKRTGD